MKHDYPRPHAIDWQDFIFKPHASMTAPRGTTSATDVVSVPDSRTEFCPLPARVS